MAIDPRRLLAEPDLLLTTGFGSGLAPRAPGTVGTVAALALYLPLSLLPMPVYAVVIVAVLALGIWLSGRVADRLAIKDPGFIVIDEFVGLWIACFALPAGWIWLIVAFAAFRAFDILKPWPVSWCDRELPGGFGIMLDDVVAGLMALAVIQLLAQGVQLL